MSDETITVQMTREEMKAAIKEAVREEFELLGLVAEEAEDRAKSEMTSASCAGLAWP